jgi:hypothetical protein
MRSQLPKRVDPARCRSLARSTTHQRSDITAIHQRRAPPSCICSRNAPAIQVAELLARQNQINDLFTYLYKIALKPALSKGTPAFILSKLEVNALYPQAPARAEIRRADAPKPAERPMGAQCWHSVRIRDGRQTCK